VTYRCEVCEDYFTVEVWHCPLCRHHPSMGETECGNCHASDRPDRRGIAGKPNGSPRGDLPLY